MRSTTFTRKWAVVRRTAMFLWLQQKTIINALYSLFLLKQQCPEEPAAIRLSKDAALVNYNQKFTASFPFYYALQMKYASKSVHNNNAILVKHESLT